MYTDVDLRTHSHEMLIDLLALWLWLLESSNHSHVYITCTASYVWRMGECNFDFTLDILYRYGWRGDWPQMLVICTDGYMMKKSKCQKCRPLSAVPAYVWNLEGHSTVFWKAGVNRGSNAERKAVAACRLLCWQQLWKPKYALDISQKIISNIVSFVTFVCFFGFFFEYVAVCLQDVNQNFSDTVWVSSLLIIINLPGRKKHA